MEEHGGHCKSLEVCRRQHYCVSRCASRSLFNSSIQQNCRRARRHNSRPRRPKPRYFASNVPRRAGTLEWHSVLLLRADDKTGYQMKSGTRETDRSYGELKRGLASSSGDADCGFSASSAWQSSVPEAEVLTFAPGQGCAAWTFAGQLRLVA